MMTVLSPPEAEHALDPADLSVLMVSLNQATERMQAAQEALRGQVSRLQVELGQANEQLRRTRSLAALGEMAAGIAHEIRNPLASILLYAQMLEDELRERPDQAGICRKINQATGRLDAIVRDVLSFARDLRIRPAPIDPEALVERSIQAVQSLASVHGVQIAHDRQVGATEIHCDASLLEQALVNLINNGIEAIAESGTPRRRITVGVSRQKRRRSDSRRAERIVFAVRDSGPGVAPEIIARMFNPFFTTRAAGTGLGLAIVHRIVDAHGGEVFVSNAPGAGACVEICLPPRGPNAAPPFVEVAVDQTSLAGAVRRRITTEQRHESDSRR